MQFQWEKFQITIKSWKKFDFCRELTRILSLNKLNIWNILHSLVIGFFLRYFEMSVIFDWFRIFTMNFEKDGKMSEVHTNVEYMQKFIQSQLLHLKEDSLTVSSKKGNNTNKTYLIFWALICDKFKTNFAILHIVYPIYTFTVSWFVHH